MKLAVDGGPGFFLGLTLLLIFDDVGLGDPVVSLEKGLKGFSGPAVGILCVLI